MCVWFLNDPVPAFLYDEVTAAGSLSPWHSRATICRVLLDLAFHPGVPRSQQMTFCHVYMTKRISSPILHHIPGKGQKSIFQIREDGEWGKCVLRYCN